MSETVYRVFMNTPMGKRYGTLYSQIQGAKISGQLDILKHKEPFWGTIDSIGNCQISGCFITLMRKVPFIATGQFTDSTVHLQLQGGHSVYELTGISDPEREENML